MRPGALVLGGSDSYTGGTIVTAGTLEIANSGALPNGSSLAVGAGGTFIFDPSATGSPLVASPDSVGAAVPEPLAVSLLAAGAIGLVGYGLRQRLARRTAMPSAFDQQPRTAAILSFPVLPRAIVPGKRGTKNSVIQHLEWRLAVDLALGSLWIRQLIVVSIQSLAKCHRPPCRGGQSSTYHVEGESGMCRSPL